MKKYLLAGIGVVLFGITTPVFGKDVSACDTFKTLMEIEKPDEELVKRIVYNYSDKDNNGHIDANELGGGLVELLPVSLEVIKNKYGQDGYDNFMKDLKNGKYPGLEDLNEMAHYYFWPNLRSHED